MAKRKSKKPTTRRRRVGAVRGNENISLIIGGAIGGIATVMIGNKLLPAMDAKIKGAVAAVAGFLVSKSKNTMLKGVGVGMGITGITGVVSSFVPAAAVGAIGYGDASVAGFEAFPNNPQRDVIAGFEGFPNAVQNNVIAGINSREATACGVC